MQQGSLPQFPSAESATTAAAQVRRGVAWCGIVRPGAECDIPQKCPGFCRVLWLICIVEIRGLLNWTAENLFLGMLQGSRPNARLVNHRLLNRTNGSASFIAGYRS
jgi:hypothetical protein